MGKVYFIHDFEKGLVKSIEEYFPKSKSIGYYYHYCKSLCVYAKTHNCYERKNNSELLFLLFFYKMHPFIQNKDIYLDNLEKMINKSTNKVKYLKLVRYNQKKSMGFVGFCGVDILKKLKPYKNNIKKFIIIIPKNIY